jgi:hypothetical protein
MWEESIPEPIIAVEDTGQSFDFWLTRPFIPDALREQLSRANVLIVPTEGHRDFDGPVFPDGTESLLHYLRDSCSEEILVDICVDDDQYVELVLHDALVIVATIVVPNIVCPLVVNAVQKYLDRNRRSNRETVKIQIVVDENGRARAISYEGPSADFERTLTGVCKGGGETVADGYGAAKNSGCGSSELNFDTRDPESAPASRRQLQGKECRDDQ